MSVKKLLGAAAWKGLLLAVVTLLLLLAAAVVVSRCMVSRTGGAVSVVPVLPPAEKADGPLQTSCSAKYLPAASCPLPSIIMTDRCQTLPIII